MAGRLANKQTKYRLIWKFSKSAVDQNIQVLLRLSKVQCHYSLTNALLQGFLDKALNVKAQNFQKPYDFLPIPTIKYYRT